MAPLLMAQFDVFANPSTRTRAIFPFLIVLQSDYLPDLDTVVVAPMIESARMQSADRLNPAFEIEGQSVLMSTAELSALPRKLLKTPIANLASERDRIIRALDLLFTGV